MFNLETNSDPRNQILAAIPAAECALLLADLETVSMEINDVVIEPDTPIEYVIFPHTALASMVADTGSGMVEAASIGREGFVGLPIILGGLTTTTTVIQVDGEVLRMRADRMLELLPELPILSALLMRYTLALFDQAAQTAACNRAHQLNERCAKWLMVISDRIGRAEFSITHKYLATMLGVRRAGVTIAAGTLQKAGAIRYTRGKMKIIDRAKLEELACDCYPVLTEISDRVLRDGSASDDSRRPIATH